MGIALVLLEFSKMFAHMGVGPAIIQRKDLEPRHLTTGFTLSLLMGALFAILLFLMAPYLATFFNMIELTQVLKAVSFIFLIDSFTLMGQALMQRNMKFRVIAAVEVTSYALGYGAVGIILAYAGWGVWALVMASLSQAILYTALLVFTQPFPKHLALNWDALKELVVFGGGMTIAKFGNYLANQGDNLVVGRMLGAGPLGIYGRAYQFMVMPASLLGNALDQALFPAMSKVQDDKQRLAKAFLTGLSILAFAAIPISVIIVFTAKEIVMVLLGPAWIDAVLPLQILASSLLFRMSYKMSDSLARAAGAVYRRAWRQLFYAAMVLTGSYVGQFWGLKGVASGVASALVINYFMMAHLSIQITGVSWVSIAKANRHGILLGFYTASVTYALVTLCRLNHLPDLLTLILVGLGAGVPVLFTMRFFPHLVVSHDLKELFDKLVLSRFKKLHTKNV
jgi:PST family polysaccharide transporter